MRHRFWLVSFLAMAVATCLIPRAGSHSSDLAMVVTPYQNIIPPLGLNRLDPTSQWITQDGLFSRTPTGYYSALDQWIALNGLFQSGNNASAFLNSNEVDRWIVLNNLFDGTNNSSPVSQWIVLSGLFSHGISEFKQLDPVSQWIILNGLFNASYNPDRYHAISQWIVLNGLFDGGRNAHNLNIVSPLDQWIVLNGLFNRSK